MKKTKITYQDRTISFRKITAKSNLVRHCVLCNKRLLPKQTIFTVYTHGPDGPFPNTTIHKKCICPPPAPFDQNNPFVWAATKLHELWNNAQKYKHWFVDGD